MGSGWRFIMALTRTVGTLGSIAQIFGMLVAFIVIVAAAYFVLWSVCA